MATVLAITLAVLSAIILALAILVAAGRGFHRWRWERTARLTAPLRPLLMRIAADDEDTEEALHELSALDDRLWRLIEPNAVALLEKVKGGAREGLVELFARRGTVARARSDLHRPGGLRRAKAVQTLGLLGEQAAFEELCSLLQDRVPEVRVVTARALGRLRNPAGAAPLLRSVAGGANPAGVVAKALVRIGPTAAPALEVGLSHQDPLVRATAAQVLGLVGPTPAADRLIPMLVEEPYAEVRTLAVRSLGLLGTRTALDALRRAAGSPGSAVVHAEVAAALGEIGAPEAIPELSALVADPHFQVAHQAARALGRLGPKGHRELMALSVAPDRAAGAHAEETLVALRVAAQRVAVRGEGRGRGLAGSAAGGVA